MEWNTYFRGAAGARTGHEIKNPRRQYDGDVVEALYSGRGFLESPIARAPAAPPNCTVLPPRGPAGHPMDKPHEGHVKVMLAYDHTLSYGDQGFRPFTPDHREAAQPLGAAVASVKVHCDHQTVPS